MKTKTVFIIGMVLWAASIVCMAAALFIRGLPAWLPKAAGMAMAAAVALAAYSILRLISEKKR